jgi:hypothetical protein
VKRQCFEKVNLGLPFFYNRCAVVLNYSTESKQTGHSRDREREMAVRQGAVATLPSLIRSLRKESPKPTNPSALPSLRRAFSLYDQINLIDNVPEDQLRFQRYLLLPLFPLQNAMNYHSTVTLFLQHSNPFLISITHTLRNLD